MTVERPLLFSPTSPECCDSYRTVASPTDDVRTVGWLTEEIPSHNSAEIEPSAAREAGSITAQYVRPSKHSPPLGPRFANAELPFMVFRFAETCCRVLKSNCAPDLATVESPLVGRFVLLNVRASWSGGGLHFPGPTSDFAHAHFQQFSVDGVDRGDNPAHLAVAGKLGQVECSERCGWIELDRRTHGLIMRPKMSTMSSLKVEVIDFIFATLLAGNGCSASLATSRTCHVP